MSIYILSLDPGLAHTGWSVLEITEPRDIPLGNFPGSALDRTKLKLIEGGVIKTEPIKKVSVSQSNNERTRLILEGLRPIFDRYTIAFVFMEGLSSPRNSSNATKTGYMRGAALSLAFLWDAPVFEATPQAIKKCLTNKKTASKVEVEEAVCAKTKPKGKAKELLDALPRKGDHEHLADAIAVAYTVYQSREFQSVLRGIFARR